MDRPLSSYTQQEALQLINAVVTTYVEAMVQEHERSKYPSVRMQLDAQPIY
jgi:predicted RNase H-like HicB family nuclease